MTNKEYREHEGISASDIKAMAKSMAYYKYKKDNPSSDDSEALLFGRAYHKFCLEPDDFDNEFIVIPKFDKRTKEGKLAYEQFCQEAQGKDVIDENTMQTLVEMRDALYSTPYARKLLTGTHEHSIFWHDEELDLECKIRPDSFTQIGEQPICVDLKTCACAETSAFMRDAMKFSYDIQASHYTKGLKATDGKDYTFVFVAQEKVKPYLVNIVQADDYFMQNGEETRKALLEQYKECVKRKEWPGYMGFSDEAEINSLSVPTWIKNALDSNNNIESEE